jgi:hypothetical protein
MNHIITTEQIQVIGNFLNESISTQPLKVAAQVYGILQMLPTQEPPKPEAPKEEPKSE